MSRLSYRNIPSAVAYFENFEGNSCRGVNDEENSIYTVYSYATKILEVNTNNENVIYFDSGKYSSTTSRIQNIIRHVFDVSKFEEHK